MSRSIKKVVGYCDRYPYGKNQANRKIRRKHVDYEISNGAAYRKEYQSWNISDWKFLYFGSLPQIKEEFINRQYWVIDPIRQFHKARSK